MHPTASSGPCISPALPLGLSHLQHLFRIISCAADQLTMVTKTASREHWLNHAEVKTEALTVVLGDWAVLGCHSPCYPPAHLHVTGRRCPQKNEAASLRWLDGAEHRTELWRIWGAPGAFAPAPFLFSPLTVLFQPHSASCVLSSEGKVDKSP